ncbi:MAG TPA: oligosaccharide flippase family protein [Firmicutes bacterium]|nr:oligosaccharide flippase family protein [Bacillota bacterium]
MRKHNGALWNTLGSAIYGLNSFIMLMMVSRFGTVEEAGVFGIAFTTAQLLYIVGLLGVSHYQMTDYKKKYCFADYKKLRYLSCILMLAVCLISIMVLRFTKEKSLLTILLSIFMLLNVVGDLYQNLFFQNNRLDLSGSALFFRTLWPLIVFCFTLVLTGQLVLALVLQILCNLVTTGYYIKKVAPAFLQKEPAHSEEGCTPKTLLLECLPLFASVLLMNFVINASKYGIEFLLNDTAQGYYNMVFMPAQVINLCSQFIFKPMLNQYAKLLETKQIAQFRKVLVKQMGLVAGFTVFCCIGAWLLGAPVLGLLYQKDLTAQVVPLIWIVFGGGIFAACQLFYYIFVIMRQQRDISYIYIFATVVSIPITYGLVNGMGITGAAISFSVVHIIILAAYSILFLRNIRKVNIK